MSGDIVIGIDDSELDAILNQVLVETDMMEEEIEEVDNEADRVKQKVDELDVASEQTYRKILEGARKTTEIMRGLAQASGNAFQEIYAIGVETALLTAELLIDIVAAESLTLVGAIQAGAKVGLIISLLARASDLAQERDEQAARTQGWVTVFSALAH